MFNFDNLIPEFVNIRRPAPPWIFRQFVQCNNRPLFRVRISGNSKLQRIVQRLVSIPYSIINNVLGQVAIISIVPDFYNKVDFSSVYCAADVCCAIRCDPSLCNFYRYAFFIFDCNEASVVVIKGILFRDIGIIIDIQNIPGYFNPVRRLLSSRIPDFLENVFAPFIVIVGWKLRQDNSLPVTLSIFPNRKDPVRMICIFIFRRIIIIQVYKDLEVYFILIIRSGDFRNAVSSQPFFGGLECIFLRIYDGDVVVFCRINGRSH